VVSVFDIETEDDSGHQVQRPSERREAGLERLHSIQSVLLTTIAFFYSEVRVCHSSFPGVLCFASDFFFFECEFVFYRLPFADHKRETFLLIKTGKGSPPRSRSPHSGHCLLFCFVVLTVRIGWTWYDSYRRGKDCVDYTAALEKASVIYNIGAFYSLEGLFSVPFFAPCSFFSMLLPFLACREKKAGSEENLKKAFSLFQVAAGVFNFIQQSQELVSVNSFLPLLFPSFNLFFSVFLLFFARMIASFLFLSEPRLDRRKRLHVSQPDAGSGPNLLLRSSTSFCISFAEPKPNFCLFFVFFSKAVSSNSSPALLAKLASGVSRLFFQAASAGFVFLYRRSSLVFFFR
jgi:hypothetical protein